MEVFGAPYISYQRVHDVADAAVVGQRRVESLTPLVETRRLVQRRAESALGILAWRFALSALCQFQALVVCKPCGAEGDALEDAAVAPDSFLGRLNEARVNFKPSGSQEWLGAVL